MGSTNLKYKEQLTKMADTKKVLISLERLQDYNTTLLTQLGLNATYGVYTAPSDKGTADNVKNALDELYGKIAGIDTNTWKGQTTLSAGDNTDLSTGAVTISLGGDGASATTKTVTLSKVDTTTWKGQTTLTGGGDLKDGEVTVTLGGDGASTTTKSITIKDTRAAKDDQVLSNDTTTKSHAYGGTQQINLSGVSGAGSNATITMPDAQTISSTGTASFGASNQKITISDATTNKEVSIAIPALTATNATTGQSEYVKVGLTDGTLSVTDTIATTFLKKTDAKNGVVDWKNSTITMTKESDTSSMYTGSLVIKSNDGNDKTATIKFDSAAFVKDGYLSSVEWGTGEQANSLIFTFNTDAGKQAIVVPMSKLIDTYTAGNGLQVNGDDAHKFEVKPTSDGYISVDANGVNVYSEKITNATGDTYKSETNLATQGYVDEKIAGIDSGVTSVKATGDDYITLTPAEETSGAVVVTLTSKIAEKSDILAMFGQ